MSSQRQATRSDTEAVATRNNKRVKTKVVKEVVPETVRQQFCQVETSTYNTSLINKLREKNEDSSIHYTCVQYPVQGMIRWGEKLIIPVAPLSTSNIYHSSGDYGSDSDFDDDRQIPSNSQSQMIGPSSQQLHVPAPPVIVCQYYNHIVIDFSSDLFIECLLHPYVEISKGRFNKSSANGSSSSGSGTGSVTGPADGPFSFLLETLLTLMNSIIDGARRVDRQQAYSQTQPQSSSRFNQPACATKDPSIYLLLTDLDASLLKVQREIAKSTKKNTSIVGNLIIPSGILEDGLAAVQYCFQNLHLLRVKGEKEAVDHLETFGRCVSSKLRDEPTLLGSYKKIKLKPRAVDGSGSGSGSRVGEADIDDETGDESSVSVCCDGEESDVDSAVYGYGLSQTSNAASSIMTGASTGRNNKSKATNDTKSRGNGSGAASITATSSTATQQTIRLNQQKELQLYKDTFCRMIIASASGISEQKACRLMDCFSNPSQLYTYILEQSGVTTSVVSSSSSSSSTINSNSKSCLHRSAHPNGHCLESKFHQTKKYTKCSHEFVKVWYETRADAAVDSAITISNNINNEDHEEEGGERGDKDGKGGGRGRSINTVSSDVNAEVGNSTSASTKAKTRTGGKAKGVKVLTASVATADNTDNMNPTTQNDEPVAKKRKTATTTSSDGKRGATAVIEVLD